MEEHPWEHDINTENTLMDIINKTDNIVKIDNGRITLFDNIKNKWKMVNARQELKFSLLDKPTIDFDLQANYIEYLPDHMDGIP